MLFEEQNKLISTSSAKLMFSEIGIYRGARMHSLFCVLLYYFFKQEYKIIISTFSTVGLVHLQQSLLGTHSHTCLPPKHSTLLDPLQTPPPCSSGACWVAGGWYTATQLARTGPWPHHHCGEEVLCRQLYISSHSFFAFAILTFIVVL